MSLHFFCKPHVFMANSATSLVAAFRTTSISSMESSTFFLGYARLASRASHSAQCSKSSARSLTAPTVTSER